MADFSLEDLKTLRERLGTGMVDSKNALVEADGEAAAGTERTGRDRPANAGELHSLGP